MCVSLVILTVLALCFCKLTVQCYIDAMSSEKNIGKNLSVVSWKELPFAISKLTENWLRWEQILPEDEDEREHSRRLMPPYYFRGQEDWTWKLESTLERELNHDSSLRRMENYFGLVQELGLDEIDDLSFDLKESVQWLSSPKELFNFHHESLNFLCHLRHYGFPSPLLDWTRSWKMAAFFALSELRPDSNGYAAIYMLGQKSTFAGMSNFPDIKILDHEAVDGIPVLRRHRNQKSCYSICLIDEFEELNRFRSIARHDDELESESDDIFRDSNFMLHRFLVPHSDAGVALHELNREGINADSLFESAPELYPNEEQRLADAKRFLIRYPR